MTVALIVAAFFAGAWFALVARALLEEAGQRRIERRSAVSVETWILNRDAGSTTVLLPPGRS